MTDAVSAVGTALTTGVTQALSVINGNMPAIFGVSLAMVAWSVGKRVLGKI